MLVELDVCPEPSHEERNAADHTRTHDHQSLDMSGLVRFGAWAVVIVVGFWQFGGLLLRAGGALLLAAGLFIAASTISLAAAVIAALGGIAWLSGHWLFALRNHYYRSPLARRMFLAACRGALTQPDARACPTFHPSTADEPHRFDREQGEVPFRRAWTASAKVTPLAKHG